jgi:hypothetical protein
MCPSSGTNTTTTIHYVHTMCDTMFHGVVNDVSYDIVFDAVYDGNMMLYILNLHDVYMLQQMGWLDRLIRRAANGHDC